LAVAVAVVVDVAVAVVLARDDVRPRGRLQKGRASEMSQVEVKGVLWRELNWPALFFPQKFGPFSFSGNVGVDDGGVVFFAVVC